jgi:autotransporter adhesin
MDVRDVNHVAKDQTTVVVNRVRVGAVKVAIEDVTSANVDREIVGVVEVAIDRGMIVPVDHPAVEHVIL